MKIERVRSGNLDRWQAFVDTMPDASLFHHAEWLNVLSESFAVVPYFLQAVDDKDQICGILPLYHSKSVLTGKHMTSLEGGVLAKERTVANDLIKKALEIRDELNAPYLLLRGGMESGIASDREIMTVRSIIRVDFNSEEIWKRLNKKTRWGVRQAKRNRIVINSNLQRLEEFYDAYARNLRDLGTPVISKRMMFSMRKHFNTKMHLFVVLLQGKVIGGMICVNTKTVWSDLYAAVIGDYRHLYGNYLLYWHAIETTCETEGVTDFDLGRSVINSGNHRFKKKWRGDDVYMPYRYYFLRGTSYKPKLEQMRERLSMKQRLWQQLPLRITNRLGPILRRQLPFS